MKILKRIESTDVFQFLGLTLLGVGLFFVYGLGWSLTGTGAILLILGFFDNSRG